MGVPRVYYLYLSYTVELLYLYSSYTLELIELTSNSLDKAMMMMILLLDCVEHDYLVYALHTRSYTIENILRMLDLEFDFIC